MFKIRKIVLFTTLLLVLLVMIGCKKEDVKVGVLVYSEY